MSYNFAPRKSAFKRAVSEGKISKKKKGGRVVFVNAALAEIPKLFN
jgi:hypothetical protein